MLSSFLRIETNHRVYREPTPIPVALSFCEAVLAAPAAHPVRPSGRHWQIFPRLCADVGARVSFLEHPLVHRFFRWQAAASVPDFLTGVIVSYALFRQTVRDSGFLLCWGTN